MKYLIETLKYLKSNLLLLPALAVAIVAFIPLVNYNAMHTIYQSFTAGVTNSKFVDWFLLFLPLNVQNWATTLLSIGAYVVLALDIAFIHSMVDKHVRFGTKSFRSIMSSMTINFVYALICVLTIFVIYAVFSLLIASIMVTFALITTPYVSIVGMVICVLLIVGLLYIAAHFFLWLPSIEITGYKIFEAVSYSYSLARPRIKKLFVTVLIPVALAYLIAFIITLFAEAAVAYVIAPIFIGCAFMVVNVAGYLAYADAEGIEREDLRKY